MMNRLRDGLLAGRKHLNPKAEMPFLDHLEELRRRLLWSLLAVAICFGIGLAVVHYLDVTRFLIEPGQEVLGSEWRLIYLAPTDSFFIFLKISLTAGLVLASPIIIYHAWAFLAPALERREKRTLVPALFMGVILFLAGVSLAYFIALPLSLRFLVGFMADVMVPSWTATGYIGFVVMLLLGFGIVFELPVVVLILSVLGLVTPAFLRAKRRHAIVIVTVVAALLSPGDMVQVTVLMMVPLVLLYEFSIWLSVLMWRRRDKHEASIGGEPAAGSVAVVPAPEEDPPPPEPNPYTHGDPARAPNDGRPETAGGSRETGEPEDSRESGVPLDGSRETGEPGDSGAQPNEGEDDSS